MVERQRIGCEHVIGCPKVFKVLSQPYHNRRKGFRLRFNLYAAICNLEQALTYEGSLILPLRMIAQETCEKKVTLPVRFLKRKAS